MSLILNEVGPELSLKGAEGMSWHMLRNMGDRTRRQRISQREF